MLRSLCCCASGSACNTHNCVLSNCTCMYYLPYLHYTYHATVCVCVCVLGYVTMYVSLVLCVVGGCGDSDAIYTCKGMVEWPLYGHKLNSELVTSSKPLKALNTPRVTPSHPLPSPSSPPLSLLPSPPPPHCSSSRQAEGARSHWPAPYQRSRSDQWDRRADRWRQNDREKEIKIKIKV